MTRRRALLVLWNSSCVHLFSKETFRRLTPRTLKYRWSKSLSQCQVGFKARCVQSLRSVCLCRYVSVVALSLSVFFSHLGFFRSCSLCLSVFLSPFLSACRWLHVYVCLSACLCLSLLVSVYIYGYVCMSRFVRSLCQYVMQCKSSKTSQRPQKPRQGDQLIHRRYTVDV